MIYILAFIVLIGVIVFVHELDTFGPQEALVSE